MSYTYGSAIWQLLYADIQNAYGVASLMGNLVAESGLIPYRVQGDFSNGYSESLDYTAKVDSGAISEYDFVNNGPGGGGYGLAQWTYYTRKQALYNLKQQKNVSIGDTNLAVEFLLYELKNDFPGVYSALKNATDIRTPSDIVLHDFESPADQSEAVEIKRAELGAEIYSLYSGLTTTFTPRTTAPESDNRYYLRPSVGGVNECIEISNGSVLPNCVGYAWGRAYEIMNSKPTLSKGDAEVWYGNTSDGYSRGSEPKLGAIICWRKGVVGDDSDGAGHVAVVEEISSDGTITTSNSAYGGTRFYTQTLSPDTNGIYQLSGYTFQGFIYLPITTDIPDIPDIPDTPDIPIPARKRISGYNFIIFNARRRRNKI